MKVTNSPSRLRGLQGRRSSPGWRLLAMRSSTAIFNMYYYFITIYLWISQKFLLDLFFVINASTHVSVGWFNVFVVVCLLALQSSAASGRFYWREILFVCFHTRSVSVQVRIDFVSMKPSIFVRARVGGKSRHKKYHTVVECFFNAIVLLHKGN